MFQFDESTHTYSRNGKVVPSCTQLLAEARIVNYDRVGELLLEWKGETGTAVHKATVLYDEDDLDWDSITGEVRAKTEAWALFRWDTGFIPRRREFPCIAMVNSLEFGMKIDVEGLISGMEAIVELKTTANILPWHGVQLAGYAMGLPSDKTNNALAKFFQRTRYAVHLLKTGKYKLHAFTDAQDAEIFTMALASYYWKLKKGIIRAEAETVESAF